MTLQRVNLAGITSAELLERIERGEQFFVQTAFANVTRVLLSGLKKKYSLKVRTTQQPGGLWIIPINKDA
jgi:hypothetical protein